MKKIVFCTLFCACIFTSLFAEDAQSKATEFEGLDASIKTYKFDGFNFTAYKPSKIGLEDIIEKEYIFIKDNLKDNEKYAIVGHSQGGLRVLGFTNYVKEHNVDMFNNLSAVITVSGVDRGLKALEGGLTATNAKIKRDLQIINSGVIGLVAIIPGYDVVLNCGEIFGFLKEDDIYDIIFPIVSYVTLDDKNFKNWLKPCLNTTSKTKEQEVLENMGEIRDMIPRSNYIEKNVLESSSYVQKVQTGSKRRLGWKKVKNRWGWRYWALRWIYTPVYTYYTRYNYSSKLPTEIPIGYIVGLKNNTLDMLGNGDEIRRQVNQLGNAMDVGKKAHIFKCCLIWGLVSGSPRYARQCGRARDYCYNIDSNINKLLGSQENDGLVAKESQYIPKELHKKYLGSDPCGYVTFDYNHKEIFYYEDTGRPPFSVHSTIKEMINTSPR